MSSIPRCSWPSATINSPLPGPARKSGTRGFSKNLEIQGVGYKAEATPYGVNLIVGYSHPVKYEAPKGIKITVDNNTMVKIEGADKELVGQVAAELRSVRPPEPYKGKGIRYAGEQVRRKAGKTGAK